MASNPLFIIVPDFFLHFPNELSYGYLRFEGNGENSFGKAGKKEGKGKALEEKITKYPVAASEIRTHDLRVGRRTPKPLRHRDFHMSSMEKICTYINMSK